MVANIKKPGFHDIVDAICWRPRMYTPTGTFYECVSYIEGIASSHPNIKNHAHTAMTPFLKWVALKLGKGKERFYWNEFRDFYGSDEQAFIELPRLYREFVGKENEPPFVQLRGKH